MDDKLKYDLALAYAQARASAEMQETKVFNDALTLEKMKADFEWAKKALEEF